MIYFTADTHFGHKNIISYCNRPFKTVEEMDNTIIDNINAVIGKDDVLYHLGDFSFGNIHEYRQRINCSNIYLCPGNHEKQVSTNDFNVLKQIQCVTIEGQMVVLCHYAMRSWPSKHYFSWNLYAHSHNTLYEDPLELQFDVGVDGNFYKPWSWEEVKERMQPKIEAIKAIMNGKNVYYLGGN